MFGMALQGMITDFSGENKKNRSGCKDNLSSIPQLLKILKTIWGSMTLEDNTFIFREAYDTLHPPSH
jgi:hypothetical protein